MPLTPETSLPLKSLTRLELSNLLRRFFHRSSTFDSKNSRTAEILLDLSKVHLEIVVE